MALILVPISLREARHVVTNFHRHNKAPQGGKFAIGCSDGDSLVGVAIVGRPVARRLQDGFTAEVTRVCALPHAPKNTCSFLYAACWRATRAMGYRRLVTYTLQTESGASLRGAGFKLIAELSANKAGWDVPSRAREWQPIYGQKKFRWERNQ